MGVAYLVMEYVDGQRIDRYCEDLALSVRDRLRLFIPICDAVDYAHRRLDRSSRLEALERDGGTGWTSKAP